MGSSGVASVIWVVLLLHFVLTWWNYIAHAKAICPGDESGWLQRVLVLPASAEALMGTAASNVLWQPQGPWVPLGTRVLWVPGEVGMVWFCPGSLTCSRRAGCCSGVASRPGWADKPALEMRGLAQQSIYSK